MTKKQLEAGAKVLTESGHWASNKADRLIDAQLLNAGASTIQALQTAASILIGLGAALAAMAEASEQ